MKSSLVTAREGHPTPSATESLAARAWALLETSEDANPWGKRVNAFLLILIGLNVIALVLESVTSIRGRIHDSLAYFEVVSVIIFTVEYLLRLWACTADPRYRGSVLGRQTVNLPV